MKERPILFSGPMVRAILEGRKTETRRIVKPQPPECWSVADYDFTRSVFVNPHANFRPNYPTGCAGNRFSSNLIKPIKCPYGVGDRLWVRETWSGPTDKQVELGALQLWAYRATDEAELLKDGVKCKWRPAIYMPRSRCRITLEILNVRVERLNEISEADAKAEGCTQDADFSREYPYSYVDQFRRVWNEINGKTAPWDSNPWVWVIEFKRLEAHDETTN